jgi:hypothetical protein
MSTKLDADGMATKAAGSDYRYTAWRKGYADAIREVAQPLADERDELREALLDLIDDKAMLPGKPRNMALANARAILAKYKKP